MGNKLAKTLLVLIATAAIVWFLNGFFYESLGEWSLSAAVGLAAIIMWPVLQYFLGKHRYAGIFYKLNSSKGLRFIDRLGTNYSRFWKFVGNAALVLMFGGLGTSFVSSKLSNKQKRIFISLLAFFVVFVYVSQTTMTLFGIYSQDIFMGLIFAIPAMLLAYAIFSPGRGYPSLLAFILGFLLFASPYLIVFGETGDMRALIYAVATGIVGLPGILIVILMFAGIGFAIGALEQSALYPALPAVENGVPVLKTPGSVGLSIPIFPDILIAFIVMLVLHEMFHGFVARAHGIRLKNTGLLITSIIPMGAFVEPDEEQFKKESEEKQARVYAVGSFANLFVIATICFFLGALLVSSGAVYSDGIVAAYVEPNSTASQFIEDGDLIYSIDGEEMLTYSIFHDFMENTTPNQTVNVVTENGQFTKQLGQHPDYPERGYLGVQTKCDLTLGPSLLTSFSPEVACSNLQGGISVWLFHLLKWIFIINVAVGLFNLLPIPILDGYAVYDQIFGWMGRKHKKLRNILLRGFAFLLLIILLLNIAPYFVNSLSDLIIVAAVLVAFILTRAKFRPSSGLLGKGRSKR